MLSAVTTRCAVNTYNKFYSSEQGCLSSVPPDIQFWFCPPPKGTVPVALMIKSPAPCAMEKYKPLPYFTVNRFIHYPPENGRPDSHADVKLGECSLNQPCAQARQSGGLPNRFSCAFHKFTPCLNSAKKHMLFS